jgi:hypothetical protein
MSTRTIGELLVGSEELKALSSRTRRLRELQTLYLRSAPRELADSSRVKSYRTGTLCISADNGAVAAKLKQLAPTLLSSIRKNDAEITAIRIEVQVGRSLSAETRRAKKDVPDQALREFEELAERVDGTGLKLALANLIRRRRSPETR